MALVAVPTLALFGFGFMNDVGVRWRIVIVPTHVIGAWLAPIVLAWRMMRRGVPLGDAVAGAVAAGVVLAVDLSLLTVGHTELQEFLLLLVGAAIAVTACVWVGAGRARVPPRPDVAS